MATKTRLTLEEFLALPETEPPCEFFDGEVVQKMSPNIPHSALAAMLGSRFIEWAATHEPSLVGVEGRHISPFHNKAYLPDVHLTKHSRLAGHETESPLSVTPDVAVEILSPDDRPSDVLRRVELYQELHVPVFLLVDPAERSVREYRAGRLAQTHAENGTLDLQPVLPDFILPLTELFAVIPTAQQS
jgi:Uma2 family endonuclease